MLSERHGFDLPKLGDPARPMDTTIELVRTQVLAIIKTPRRKDRNGMGTPYVVYTNLGSDDYAAYHTLVSVSTTPHKSEQHYPHRPPGFTSFGSHLISQKSHLDLQTHLDLSTLRRQRDQYALRHLHVGCYAVSFGRPRHGAPEPQ